MSDSPFHPSILLDLERTAHADLFASLTHAWEALPALAPYLADQLQPKIAGDVSPSATIGENVFIGAGTTVEPGVTIKGPAWIGENCQLRSGCYVRENVIVGNGVVMGNSCEFKNCLLFDEAQVPHFNYVGDSILGYRAHLGAGTILSNVRLDHAFIRLYDATTKKWLDTGLRKFGAILGDRVEIGCNSVLSPGSILGRDSMLYPGTHWQKGALPAAHIVQVRQTQQLIKKR